jgi:hypothetical protein
MSDCADAARVSHDDRRREAAEILAAGLLRLSRRSALSAENALENPAKLPPEGLEVPEETVLSVHAG